MRVDERDQVAILRLEAGKANAMGPDFLLGVGRLLDEAEPRDPRAYVLVGYEKFFCAGLDLPALLPLDRPSLGEFMDLFAETMLRVFALPRPVIAAVNGHAIAGGCVLALQADERLMAEEVGKIGLTEVPLGLGLPAEVVETLRAQVPPSSLGPVALEGRTFSAREALALGLVHAAVPSAELLDRAMARAQALAALPSPAFAQVKAALRRPVLETVTRVQRQEAKRWLDTWFSRPTQELLHAAVARLKK
ncbi:MAG: enoyl-CoA hydratase/isomerase family protein [Deltaproteobacteria bacterium]|nr:enoyl-CoA hydratase/isomerase family protein [Deltaproteobacteria bacterium]